jgi:hypothetical protein
MNREEIEELIRQLKAAGLDEEKIMEVFYAAFEEGKMDRKDLETLTNAMGYELTDDFKNDETPDPIASKSESEEDIDLSDEDLDNLDVEEMTEKLQGEDLAEDDNEEEVEEEETEDSDSDSEEDERKEAMKLFRLGDDKE